MQAGRRRAPAAGAWVAAAALWGLLGCAGAPREIASNADPLLIEQPGGARLAWVHGDLMRAAVVGERTDPAIVFVHGSPGSWEAGAHLLAMPWMRDGHLLIAYDRPGYGGSSPHHTEPSLAAQAAALAGLLDALGARGPVILVGHSLGGPVIARFAMDFPERTAGLVFVAASADPALERWRWYNVAAGWRIAGRLLPEPLIRSNEEIEPLKGELEALLPRWAQINAPAAIIHGTDDRLVPIGNADFLRAHLSGAPQREWIVPGETHGVLWHQPALIEAAVRWLEWQNGAKDAR